MKSYVRFVSFEKTWTGLVTLWMRYLVDIVLKCRFCVSNKLPDCAGPDGLWVPFEEPGFRHLALGPFLHDGGANLYLGEG